MRLGEGIASPGYTSGLDRPRFWTHAMPSPTRKRLRAAAVALAAVAAVVVPYSANRAVAPVSGQSRACWATDGDTIRCGKERIRLLGIDAPELPGHCRKGRRCAPGDPYASKASLSGAMAGRLSIRRVGRDRYGRTLALVSGASGDLSCYQLAHGRAIYRADWDNGRLLASICAATRLTGFSAREISPTHIFYPDS